MNSFGSDFRVSIFGESHGEGLGITIDGCPAGIPLVVADFEADLSRRASGTKGTTPRKEADIPRLFSGVFGSTTTGAPLTILFTNIDADSSAYISLKDTPRPGHADFVAHKKFGGFQDYRGGGHFSGRLTAALVAAGVVAKKVVPSILIKASLIEVGGSTDFDQAIDEAVANGDSVGGIVECRICGVPVGLGEPFFNSLESAIAQAVFSVPATKGIEFGSGFGAARMKGSEHNDEILDASGRTKTNFAGGINGGISNGNDIIFRVAIKPTSSIKKDQSSVNLSTGQKSELTVRGRHDACIALRIAPVIEAVAAMVMADMSLKAQNVKRVWEG